MKTATEKYRAALAAMMRKEGTSSMLQAHSLLVTRGLNATYASFMNWYNGTFAPDLGNALVLSRTLNIDMAVLHAMKHDKPLFVQSTKERT